MHRLAVRARGWRRMLLRARRVCRADLSCTEQRLFYVMILRLDSSASGRLMTAPELYCPRCTVVMLYCVREHWARVFCRG